MRLSTFEMLEVWKAGRRLGKQISKVVKDLPAIEQYRLVDQIVRSSRSVTTNIAEGYGRYHYQENIQYCRQARGSLFKFLDHLYVALDVQYMLLDLFNDLKAETFLVIKILNGYVNHLKKQKTVC